MPKQKRIYEMEIIPYQHNTDDNKTKNKNKGKRVKSKPLNVILATLKFRNNIKSTESKSEIQVNKSKDIRGGKQVIQLEDSGNDVKATSSNNPSNDVKATTLNVSGGEIQATTSSVSGGEIQATTSSVSGGEIQPIASNVSGGEIQAVTSNDSGDEIQITTSVDSGVARRATTSGKPKLARSSSWNDLNKCEIRDEDKLISLIERCKDQKFLEKVGKILEEKRKSGETMLKGDFVLLPDEKTAYECGNSQYTSAKGILEKLAQSNTEEEYDLRDRFGDNQLTGAQKRLLNAAWEAAQEVQSNLDMQGSQNRSLSPQDGTQMRSLLRSLTRMALSQVFSADRCAHSDEVETLEIDVARLAKSPGLVKTQHRIFLAKNFEQLKAEYPDHSDEGIFRLAWEKTFNDTWEWMGKEDSNGHTLVVDDKLEAKNILKELDFRGEENLKKRIKSPEEKKRWWDYVNSPSVAVVNTVVQLASFFTGIQTLYQIRNGLSWIKDLPWNDQG
jgi:hypothetical protein